jgi:hypothetical protein
MWQWYGNNRIQHEDYVQRLGIFGDTVDFATLSEHTRTPAVAEAFGARERPSDSQREVCGSPGEVANAPELGHLFQIFTNSGGGTDFRGSLHGKLSVHTTMSLFATDQLRQRVAWALSQIYVIGVNGVVAPAHHECFVNYYDILVRNAFGSLGSLLREVSYSPIMGEYLTFIDSSSLASSGTPADENYVRSNIMSLPDQSLHISLQARHTV